VALRSGKLRPRQPAAVVCRGHSNPAFELAREAGRVLISDLSSNFLDREPPVVEEFLGFSQAYLAKLIFEGRTSFVPEKVLEMGPTQAKFVCQLRCRKVSTALLLDGSQDALNPGVHCFARFAC